jgi:DNA-binding LacI/PurR family transcriptional regulator
VPLTSVRQPAHRIGRTAAELLIAETDEPGEPAVPGEGGAGEAAGHTHRRIVFQPELVVRSSSLPGHRKA